MTSSLEYRTSVEEIISGQKRRISCHFQVDMLLGKMVYGGADLLDVNY